ncbi:MAG: OmpW family outer membrane protein [Rariglobus sp.]
MKTPLMAAGVLLLAFTSAFAADNVNPWSVRLRATYMQTIDHSDAVAGLIPTNGIKVSELVLPEVDIGYAFNERWSAELVLTIPQEHDVRINKGALAGTKLGDFKHLPPTLFLQYHPDFGTRFRPYIGVGVNFTLIFDDNLSVGGTRLTLENYSIGPAGQVGFDYVLNERWAINVDVKKIVISTDVDMNGSKLTEVRVDPWLYSLGLTYQF